MRMNMLVAILVAVSTALFSTSCMGPRYNFPADIKDECYGAKNEAKAKIQGRGTKLGEEHGGSVTKHPGEKKINGMWCWMSPEWGQYVGGLCWGGSRIEVGCNPQTMGEVMYAVEEHEFAHWYLIPIGSNGHDPLYRQDFFNWVEPRGKTLVVALQDVASAKVLLKAEIAGMKSGEWVSLNGRDTNGVPYHIDFVKE